jgi:hypothetical protein
VSLHSEVQKHIHKVRQQGKRGPYKKKTSKHPVVTPKQIHKRYAEFSHVVSPSLPTNSDDDDSSPTRASMASDSRWWSHSAITVFCIRLSIWCARVIDGWGHYLRSWKFIYLQYLFKYVRYIEYILSA